MNVLEDLSALVALCAALVSALAAIYARWQANAAKRANEISLHESRLKVYNRLSRFRVHLTGSGPSLKEEEVWTFFEAVEASEFYYPAYIQPRLQYVFDEAMKLLTLNDEWRHACQIEPTQAPSLVKPRYDLSLELRDECQRITDEIKPYLRIGEA
jgi:hypothetical protein